MLSHFEKLIHKFLKGASRKDLNILAVPSWISHLWWGSIPWPRSTSSSAYIEIAFRHIHEPFSSLILQSKWEQICAQLIRSDNNYSQQPVSLKGDRPSGPDLNQWLNHHRDIPQWHALHDNLCQLYSFATPLFAQNELKRQGTISIPAHTLTQNAG